MALLFPQRLSRLQYLLRVFGFFAVVVLLIAILVVVIPHDPTATEPPWIRIVLGAIYVIPYFGYFLPFILAPRLRDVGMSPWMSLLALVVIVAPLITLAALFAPAGWWTRRQQMNAADPS
jgi:uncharacterized membrane protein YhaH (DUF805 family)